VVDLEVELRRALTEGVGEILARSIVQTSLRSTRIDLTNPTLRCCDELLEHLGVALNLYIKDDTVRRSTAARIGSLVRRAAGRPSCPPAPPRRQVVDISEEAHIVVARGAARDLCAAVGCAVSTQIKIATVVSELARNIIQYAGSGVVDIEVTDSRPPVVVIRAVDHGPGIADVEGVLGGHYRSRTGMGMGLIGAKRLMDDFIVTTSPGQGTSITARKYL
jgi:serine/threonine-protein kinase RsbT